MRTRRRRATGGVAARVTPTSRSAVLPRALAAAASGSAMASGSVAARAHSSSNALRDRSIDARSPCSAARGALHSHILMHTALPPCAAPLRHHCAIHRRSVVGTAVSESLGAPRVGAEPAEMRELVAPLHPRERRVTRCLERSRAAPCVKRAPNTNGRYRTKQTRAVERTSRALTRELPRAWLGAGDRPPPPATAVAREPRAKHGTQPAIKPGALPSRRLGENRIVR